MSVVTSKRSVMTLFTGKSDPMSHRARIVLNEKNVTFEVHYVEDGDLPEDLIDLNPYNTVPTLVDRDLVLYDSRVIIEYLDERFPHPPLMPVDPVSRARTRLMLHRIDRDWYSLLPDLEGDDKAKRAAAGKELRDSLVSLAPLFDAKPYFISDDYSLIDCVVAPLLWRFDHWGIVLPPQAKAIVKYADRLFERSSFQDSLTKAERELRA